MNNSFEFLFIYSSFFLLIFGCVLSLFIPFIKKTVNYGKLNTIHHNKQYKHQENYSNLIPFSSFLSSSPLYLLINKFFSIYFSSHFYISNSKAFILYYSYSLIWCIFIIIYKYSSFSTSSSSFLSFLLLFLYSFHIFRRLIESLFVFNSSSSSSNQHFIVFFTALFYYSLVPISLFDDSPLFYSIYSSYFILIGIILFFISNYSQYLHHSLLAKLRKKKKPQNGSLLMKQDKFSDNNNNNNNNNSVNPNTVNNISVYSIPSGLLFDVVYCPHYFFEILIYFSLCLIANSFSSYLILLWVIINLSITAKKTKIWYKESGLFPIHQLKEKWIIIPFIY